MNTTKNLLVLISTYNHENYIKNCINSVLKQKTKYNIKIICFDDCSTDRTFKILKKIQKLFPKKIQIVKNEKNLGRGTLSIIKNSDKYSQDFDYWTILDGDDKWLNKSRVEKQINILENNSDYIGCCGYTKVFDKNGKFLKLIKPDLNYFSLNDLIARGGLYFHTSSVIWKNIYYKKYKFILPKKKI